MRLRISAEVRIGGSLSTVKKEREEQPGGQGNQITKFPRVWRPPSLEALKRFVADAKWAERAVRLADEFKLRFCCSPAKPSRKLLLP